MVTKCGENWGAKEKRVRPPPDHYNERDLTFSTGLDLTAMDFRSSMAALAATEVRDEGDGAKAAADPIRRERRDSFMAPTKVYLIIFLLCSPFSLSLFSLFVVVQEGANLMLNLSSTKKISCYVTQLKFSHENTYLLYV